MCCCQFQSSFSHPQLLTHHPTPSQIQPLSVAFMYLWLTIWHWIIYYEVYCYRRCIHPPSTAFNGLRFFISGWDLWDFLHPQWHANWWYYCMALDIQPYCWDFKGSGPHQKQKALSHSIEILVLWLLQSFHLFLWNVRWALGVGVVF